MVLFLEKDLTFCSWRWMLGDLYLVNYFKIVEIGLSEISWRVITPNMDECDSYNMWYTETAGTCLRCVHVYVLCIAPWFMFCAFLHGLVQLGGFLHL